MDTLPIELLTAILTWAIGDVIANEGGCWASCRLANQRWRSIVDGTLEMCRAAAAHFRWHLAGGRLRAAKWFVDRYRLTRRLAIGEDGTGIYCAAFNGHLRALRWACRKFGILREDAASYALLAAACDGGRLAIAQWLERAYRFDAPAERTGVICGLIFAARGGSQPLTEWMCATFAPTPREILTTVGRFNFLTVARALHVLRPQIDPVC